MTEHWNAYTTGTFDLAEVRRKQAEKWAEVVRIATQAANAQGEARWLIAADLLAEIGVIHNTPDVKRRWCGVWSR